jgi:hypothetical protein
MRIGRGKGRTRRKFALCHVVNQKSHRICPGIETGSTWRKKAANCFRYDNLPLGRSSRHLLLQNLEGNI